MSDFELMDSDCDLLEVSEGDPGKLMITIVYRDMDDDESQSVLLDLEQIRQLQEKLTQWIEAQEP